MAFSRIPTRRFEVYMVTCAVNQKSYIGITSISTRARWRDHVRNAMIPAKSYALGHGIKRYGAEKFSVKILCVVQGFEEAGRVERAAISAYGTLAPTGYNIAHGGEGGIDPVSRAKISAALTGRKADPKAVEKRAAKLRGRPCSPDTRAKIAASNTGKKHSKETRGKLSVARRARLPAGVATREKLRRAMLGRSFSPESLAKMKAAARNRDPAQRIKAVTTRRARGNYAVTEETRQRMRAAWTARRESGEDFSVAARKAWATKKAKQRPGHQEAPE